MWDFVNKVWIKKGKKYGYCKNPGGLCGNLQSKENCKFSEDLNTQRNARVVHIKKMEKSGGKRVIHKIIHNIHRMGT